MDVLKRCLSENRTQRNVQPTLKRYALDITRRRPWRRQPGVSTAKTLSASRGCPVAINIPGFIQKVKEGEIEEAYQIISEASALPAVCGVSAHRRASVKGNVSEESRVIPFLSASWSVLWQTGPEKTASSRRGPKEEKRKEGCCDRFRTSRTYLCGRFSQNGL